MVVELISVLCVQSYKCEKNINGFNGLHDKYYFPNR